MERERLMLQRLLPRTLFARIDIENTSIRRFLERAAAELPDGALVLDAGAGRCQYRELFAGQRYIGVDFTRGETTWDYSQLDVVGVLEHLPFRAASFDAAICTQVLEHVPEPLGVLRELLRVLKPGGTLYLTAPQAFGEHQEPHDYYRYTSFGLRYLFDQAGFAAVSVSARGGYYWFLSAMLMYAYQKMFTGPQPKWKKALLFLPRLAAAFVLLLALPQLLYCLDQTDRRRDITLGYECVGRRAGP